MILPLALKRLIVEGSAFNPIDTVAFKFSLHVIIVCSLLASTKFVDIFTFTICKGTHHLLWANRDASGLVMSDVPSDGNGSVT